MISLMGNCMSWIKKKQSPRNNCHTILPSSDFMKLTLVMIGLDNAGKTLTALGLQGEPIDNTTPTVGFDQVDFQFENFDISMFDLGGGKKIRSIWKNYFTESYGVVFCIDSSDQERLDECREVLTEVLQDSKISGKPVLMLANKQDIDGCYTEAELLEYLDVEQLVNSNKCPCRMVTCSAIKGTGKKIDQAIKNGMHWLLYTVEQNFDKYHDRVEADKAELKEIQARERMEKRERVRKIREERERQEELERQKSNKEEEAKPNSDDEDIMDGGDPFKKVDIQELKAKEAKAKEEKAKRKALMAAKAKEEENESKTRDSPADNDTENVLENANMNNNARPSGGLRRQRSNLSEEDDENEVISSKASRPKADSPRPLDGMALQPAPLSRRLAPLQPITQLEPLDVVGDGMKKKKKKKKVKRNKTVPMLEDDETGEVTLSKKALPPLKSSPPAQRNLLSRTASRKPELESVEDEANIGQKWNLAEDLEDMPARPTRPNVDSDDDIMT